MVHDHAYAELNFDGFRSPSLLQVPGAKAWEWSSIRSPKPTGQGWRVGFMVGNREAVAMLTRIKTYLDYGMFAPIQIAAIAALNGPQDCVAELVNMYRSRRDVLVEGLNKMGWARPPNQRAPCFSGLRLERSSALSSVDFALKLLQESKVAVSPGAGFGEGGEGYVRFALIENEQRTQQALRGIKRLFA